MNEEWVLCELAERCDNIMKYNNLCGHNIPHPHNVFCSHNCAYSTDVFGIDNPKCIPVVENFDDIQNEFEDLIGEL